MLKHILVPLDESELSEAAIPYARSVAGPDGKVTLLRVVDEMSMPSPRSLGGSFRGATEINYEQLKLDMMEHAQAYLEDTVRDIKREIPKSDIEVRYGRPAEAIITAAEELKVDAIVMSTHGRSGFARWMLGSVTQKVLDAKPCPILIIPSRKSNNNKKNNR